MDFKELIESFRSMAYKAVDTVKEEIEEFKDRWAPDVATAMDRFEDLKKRLEASLHNVGNLVEEHLIPHPEELKKIRLTIDELRLQLVMGKAETLEAFEEQKKQILVRWKLLNAQIEELPGLGELKDHVNRQLNEWRVQLEVMKIQYALGRMEWKENWKNISSDLGKEVDNLGKAMEAGAGIAGEKLDKIEEEIQRIVKKYAK